LRALGSRHPERGASIAPLFELDGASFRGEDEDLNYATGEQAFAAVMGKTPAAVNADWREWVRRL